MKSQHALSEKWMEISLADQKRSKTSIEKRDLWHLGQAWEDFKGSVTSFKAMSRRLQSTTTRKKWWNKRHLGFQRRQTIPNGSASFQHAGVRARSHTTTQDKGQIFGSGLQLCASGASAEPESAAPYRDQRHPHTVKCQAQRRAGESEPKRGGEDKTCFIVVVNLGVARWKGQGSTLWHWVLPRTFPNSFWVNRCATMLPLFWHPSVMFHFLSHLPASVSLQHSASRRLGCFFVIMLLDFIWAKYAAGLFMDQLTWLIAELVMNKLYFIGTMLLFLGFHLTEWEFKTFPESRFPIRITETLAFVQVHMWAIAVLLKPH